MEKDSKAMVKKQNSQKECTPGIAGGNEEEYAKFLKYSKDFRNPVQDEGHRQLIDNAKKRAAAQHADYPTFAAIVSAAHLKPFHRDRDGLLKASGGQGCINGKHVSPAWSFDAKGALQDEEEINPNIARKFVDNGNEISTFIRKSVPHRDRREKDCSSYHPLKEQNQQERISIYPKCISFDGFMKEWRKFGRDELDKKLHCLLKFNPHQLSQIFKVEIPPTVLAEIVETLHRGYARDLTKLEKLSPINAGEKDLDGNAHEKQNEENTLENAERKKYSRWVVRILESLGKCGRFSLSLKLVGDRTRCMASELCKLALLNSASSSLEEENGMGTEKKRFA
eukprot:Gb_15186 [translate_table: standard]